MRWPRKPRQAEALGDDALAGEGGVARDQERHRVGAVLRRRAELILLGAGLAEHHRVDDLEMRGIGGERQMDLVAVELAVGRGAEVILDVARAVGVVGRGRAALELVEDRAMRLRQNMGEHVEPAAMGHAERNVLHAERAAALDDLLQRRDHRFAAVEAEPLGAGELEVGELLEAFRLDELVEDRPLALAGEADLLVRPLDALLDPALLLGIGDVHELDPERLAVGALEDRQHLAQGAELEAEHVVEEDRPVEIGIGESVAAGIELLGVLARLEAERIEIGMEMAAHADRHGSASGRAPNRGSPAGRGPR